MAAFGVVCSLCNFRSPSLTLWLSHLRQVHRSDPAVNITCPVSTCRAFYDKVNSFCSHVYRSHRALCICTNAPDTNTQASTALETATRSSILIETNSIMTGELQHDVDQLLQNDLFEQRKKSSLYLLQIKEERMISQAAINDVVKGCQEVFEHTVGRIKAGVKHKLSCSGIDPMEVSGLDELFESVTDPFSGLETFYLQDNFVLKELGCIGKVH